MPAQMPSWYDANAYCLWLSKKSGLPIDMVTEAQWEYAARSRGRYVPYATDNGWLEKGRNWGKDYESIPSMLPKPVGLHPPNPLGLYDMQANACEWVRDWYDSDYYSTFDLSKPTKNPQGPVTGEKKMCRGADLIGTPWYNTVVSRFKTDPTDSHYTTRCVLNLSKQMTNDELESKLK